MIQPNEKLLPGNVVMFNGEDGKDNDPNRLLPSTIYKISRSDFYKKLYSPIPLTPEILVKWCGIMENPDQYFMMSHIIWIRKNKTFDKWEIYFKGKPVRTISNLHEMQNTVYFISGEEMPVNIPNN